MEFAGQGIPVSRNVHSVSVIKGNLSNRSMFPTSSCFDKIVVEIKAVTELTALHRAQLQNYLKATGYKLGFLVNFGHYPKLEYERIVK